MGDIIVLVTMLGLLATKFYSTDAPDADAKIGVHNVIMSNNSTFWAA
jgi:hypothetical protein